MKQFIVALCLVAVVLAGKKPEKRAPPPEGGPKGPPCNVTKPEGVEKRDCCPGLPRSLSCLAGKTCGGPGGKKGSGDKKDSGDKKGPGDICAFGACVYANYTINGEINVDAVASAIAATVNGSDPAVWTEFIKSTVSDCVDNAPVEIQKMQDKLIAASSSNDTKGTEFIKKFLSCDPKVQTQLAVEFCLKKNLFNNCPTRVTSDKCNALYTWAQACPHAAFHGGKGGKGPKNDSSEEKGQAQKGGNQGKKGAKGEKSEKSEKQSEKKGEKQAEKKGEKQAEKKGDNKNNQGKQQQQQQQQKKN